MDTIKVNFGDLNLFPRTKTIRKMALFETDKCNVFLQFYIVSLKD